MVSCTERQDTLKLSGLRAWPVLTWMSSGDRVSLSKAKDLFMTHLEEKAAGAKGNCQCGVVINGGFSKQGDPKKDLKRS